MGVLSLRIFFLPLGSRYQNFDKEYVRSMDRKYTGAFKPVISLNTTQIPALFENDFFKKIVGFRFLGFPLFLPPQMLRCISIALGKTSKTPISDLRYLLPFSQN